MKMHGRQSDLKTVCRGSKFENRGVVGPKIQKTEEAHSTGLRVSFINYTQIFLFLRSHQKSKILDSVLSHLMETTCNPTFQKLASDGIAGAQLEKMSRGLDFTSFALNLVIF